MVKRDISRLSHARELHLRYGPHISKGDSVLLFSFTVKEFAKFSLTDGQVLEHDVRPIKRFERKYGVEMGSM
jgi:hypothetical protein